MLAAGWQEIIEISVFLSCRCPAILRLGLYPTNKNIYLCKYGNKPRNLARFTATASSRCFFAETDVILLGIIFRVQKYISVVILHSYNRLVASLARRVGNCVNCENMVSLFAEMLAFNNLLLCHLIWSPS